MKEAKMYEKKVCTGYKKTTKVNLWCTCMQDIMEYHTSLQFVQDECKTNGFKELEPFLTSQQRTKPIQADGNCFYRAISEALYGHEDDHKRIRDTLANYTLLNRRFCEVYPIND